nr:hypothetical protein [Tanacetum cinerariifolium]
MNPEQQQASPGRSPNEAAMGVVGLELRVCRGVGYGMVRDCRELVAYLARKQERDVQTRLAGIKIKDSLGAEEWKWKEYSGSCDVEASVIQNQGDFSEYNDLRDCGGRVTTTNTVLAEKPINIPTKHIQPTDRGIFHKIISFVKNCTRKSNGAMGWKIDNQWWFTCYGVSSLYIDLGESAWSCEHCVAMFWYGERLKAILRFKRFVITHRKRGVETTPLIPNYGIIHFSFFLEMAFHNAAMGKQRRDVGARWEPYECDIWTMRVNEDVSSENGSQRCIQYPFLVNKKVLINGNRRTPNNFVGKKAIITSGVWIRLKNTSMNKDSMARLAKTSAAEAMAATGMWEVAHAHAANPAQTRVSNGSLPLGTMSQGIYGYG